MATYVPLPNEEIDRTFNLYASRMGSVIRRNPNPDLLDPYIKRMALDTFLVYYLGTTEKRQNQIDYRFNTPYSGIEKRMPLKRWKEFEHLLQPILDKAYSHDNFKGGIRLTPGKYIISNQIKPRLITHFVISRPMQKVLKAIIGKVHKRAFEERERNSH